MLAQQQRGMTMTMEEYTATVANNVGHDFELWSHYRSLVRMIRLGEKKWLHWELMQRLADANMLHLLAQ